MNNNLGNNPTSPLSIASFIFGIAWVVCFFFLHMTGYVHLLLAVAIILTIVKIGKNPVR